MTAKILLVVDFPAETDIRQGTLISSGSSAGKELDGILADVGLSRADVVITSVFDRRPPNGDLNAWAVERKTLKTSLDPLQRWQPIPCKKGVVDPKIVQPALERLAQKVAMTAPNVIVALGNPALAALCGVNGIGKLRGALHFYGQVKVIPTYAINGVLANYEWRPAVVADFMKVVREAAAPQADLINRRVYIRPTRRDLEFWTERLCGEAKLAFDIETKAKQITCIGFAPNKEEVFVVPFWHGTESYWSAEDEAFAYKCVRKICMSPAVKIAQNGIYDVQYLFKYHIPVRNFIHDTMLLHHALYPALPKGLEFLGSIYANDRAWKRWRVRGGDTHELKRDE
jgi:uracil-DNA glycosylase